RREDQRTRREPLDRKLSREALVDVHAFLDSDTTQLRFEKGAHGQLATSLAERRDDAMRPRFPDDGVEPLHRAEHRPRHGRRRGPGRAGEAALRPPPTSPTMRPQGARAVISSASRSASGLVPSINTRLARRGLRIAASHAARAIGKSAPIARIAAATGIRLLGI